MASTRRLGSERSTTRIALMDAVEDVMRTDGYGALSARAVAERAGLKHQLVYYYFQTMDDLLLATYRRRTRMVLEKTRQLLSGENPLHAFWQALSEPSDAVLTMEYFALANHNDAIRRETVVASEVLNDVKEELLPQRCSMAEDGNGAVTPYSMSVAIDYVACLIGFATAIGIGRGHEELRRLVEAGLDALEPAR